MALSNTKFIRKQLENKEEEINKILEKYIDNNDSLNYKTIGVSYPPEILCWLPVIGNIMILFGMKEYILGVTNKKIIISQIDIESIKEKKIIELQKEEIKKVEKNNETITIFTSNKKYTFKEMPKEWISTLTAEIKKLIK